MDAVILADIVFSTEAIVIVGTLMTALTGAIALLYRHLMASKQSELDSYKEIADEAVSNLEKLSSRHAGNKRVAKLVPVVPEHNSPTTPLQQRAADLQTMRARLVAATLQGGLMARKPSPLR